MVVQTVTLETQIPEDVYLTLKSLGLHREILASRSRRLLAVQLFQERMLSLGKAARLANMSRWDFIEYLDKNHIPVIDLDEEEFAAELTTVNRLSDILDNEGMR